MKKMTKITLEIDEKLLSNIKQYCSYNNLILYKYINTLIKESFNVDRYGDIPGCFLEKDKNIKNDVKDIKTEEIKKENIPIVNTATETKTATVTTVEPVTVPITTSNKPIEIKKVTRKKKRSLN